MTDINIFCEMLAAAVTAMMMIFLMAENTHKDAECKYLLCTMLSLFIMLTSDILTLYLDGKTEYRIIMSSTMYIDYVSCFAMVFFFLRYFKLFITPESRFIRVLFMLSDGILLITLIGLIANVFNGMYFQIDSAGRYILSNCYWMTNIYAVVTLGSSMIILCIDKKLNIKYKILFLFYAMLPLSGTIIDYYIPNMAFTYICSFLGMLLLDMQLHVWHARELTERKAELTQSRISIMLSQIQPHFLYNSLNSIYYLCEEDPLKAQQAIGDFSDYLRGNLDSLKRTEPVPFEQELKHIQIYLSLEKMRFDKKLNVVYDIETMDFCVPALSIQPIVENAVRYGVGKKAEGGTVMLRVKEKPDSYCITVSDDGVGFDPYETQDDGRTHVGIDNVKTRLKMQINGEMTINSRKGIGTEVNVVIPREQADESNRS